MSELTLIYDGECDFCKGWVEWAWKRDVGQKIEFLPCQSEKRKRRFPQIHEKDCLEAMQGVLPNGRVLPGAEAAPHVLKRLPGWKWLSMILSFSPILFLVRPIYRFIARNRHRLAGCRAEI